MKKSTIDASKLKHPQRAIWEAIKRSGYTLKELSLYLGHHHAYLHHFFDKGTPVELSEDDRINLSYKINMHPNDMKNKSFNLIDMAASGIIMPKIDNSLIFKKSDRIRLVRELMWMNAGGIQQACEDLKISIDSIKMIEFGDIEPDLDFRVRFCGLTGCPWKFIESGSMCGMRWELIAWIGHIAPRMLPSIAVIQPSIFPSAKENHAQKTLTVQA